MYVIKSTVKTNKAVDIKTHVKVDWIELYTRGRRILLCKNVSLFLSFSIESVGWIFPPLFKRERHQQGYVNRRKPMDMYYCRLTQVLTKTRFSPYSFPLTNTWTSFYLYRTAAAPQIPPWNSSFHSACLILVTCMCIRFVTSYYCEGYAHFNSL